MTDICVTHLEETNGDHDGPLNKQSIISMKVVQHISLMNTISEIRIFCK